MNKFYVSFLSLMVSSTALVSGAFATNSIMEDFVSISPSRHMMSPVIPEEKTFSYKGMTSYQASPLTLKVLNEDFIIQTGGGIKRAVGTAELLSLVNIQLGGTNIAKLTEQEKDTEAKASIVSMLEDQPEEVVQQYKKSGDLPSEALSHIYQNLKNGIFKKVELKEEDISQEEFAKGNEEVISHTIIRIGDENDLPSVKQVNKLVDEFEELIPGYVVSNPTKVIASIAPAQKSWWKIW